MAKLKQKHKNCNTRIVHGRWGPHRAKIVCDDCNGTFVSWCKSKTQNNQYKENKMKTYSYTLPQIQRAQTQFEDQLQMYLRRKEKGQADSCMRITQNAPNLFEILESVSNSMPDNDAVAETLHLKQFLKSR